MKKIKAIIRDKNTLILDEDASKGDIIDLSELNIVDTSTIEQAIVNNKDEMYQIKVNEKLKEQKLLYEANKQNEINELKAKYNKEKIDLENKLNESRRNKELELNNEISDLLHQIELLKSNEDALLKSKELEIENKYKDEINSLKSSNINLENNYKNEINSLKETQSNFVEKLKLEHQNEINNLNNKIENINNNHKFELEKAEADYKLQKEQEINALKDLKDKEILEKNEQISFLTRQKASLNVKQTGENLEVWCDYTVKEQLQNGFFNCTWTKDNVVVKNDDEQKGSKADFIFKVYASENHLDNELLTSLCLDMKDENPDSVKKQTNEHYYPQLDKNRIKKNCEYAVLVSNLETDNACVLPIFKVREYENMYVVRPAYLMTFLHMITSLTMKFRKLILENEKESLAIKDKTDFINEFNDIKNTYLNKPLESLEKNIEIITKANSDIMKASDKINESVNNIKTKYLAEIQAKIDRFEIKINKGYNKFN